MSFKVDFIKKMFRGKICPYCLSRKTYFDPGAGPIAGGLIVPHATKSGRIVHSGGAHPVGEYKCMKCGKMF